MEQLSDDILLPVEKAAFVLNVSTSTLNHWRSDGLPPPYIPLGAGKRPTIRYRMHDLREFIRSKVTTSTASHKMLAMGRITLFDLASAQLHPFWSREPFVVDSVFSDHENFMKNFCDPTTNITWLKIADGLSMPWTDEKLRESYLSTIANRPDGERKNIGKSMSEIESTWKENMMKLDLNYWHSSGGLTIDDRLKIKPHFHPDYLA